MIMIIWSWFISFDDVPLRILAIFFAMMGRLVLLPNEAVMSGNLLRQIQ